MLYELVRCPKCSHTWLKDAPRLEEMAEHYGPYYDRFITAAGESSPDKARGRAEVVERYKSSGALLDLGCSSGAFLESLQSGNWQLFGIEVSAETARRAEETTGARVFVGDILEAPFPPESFDVITCFDVLEHVHEPKSVLEKVHRWLKPGGIFYTQLPNINSGEARLFKSFWYGLELPRHLQHFSPEAMRYLADLVGLQEVSIETHRNSALEYSLRYVKDDLLKQIGVTRPCLAEANPPRLPWKVIRKALRWTAFPALYYMSRTRGSGESIHAVLQKAAVPADRAGRPVGDART
ncbi:MAG: class I SAM-dependent methyltransferase [Candidatus Sulfotelmatobacter sp.]